MIGLMKFLALTLNLLARITLTFISSFAIIVCFQKVNFQVYQILMNFSHSFNTQYICKCIL